MILQLLGLMALAYLAWSLVAMEINYRRASALGIPVVRACIDNSNVLWTIIQPQLQPWLDRIPIDWGNFGRYCRRDWAVIDGNQSFLRYGPIWALATPCEIYIHIVDSEAIHDIFQRRTDFIRPNEMYSMLMISHTEDFLLIVSQRCSKFMAPASPQPAGRTGRVTGKCWPRRSTKRSCLLFGMKVLTKLARC